ncbi:ExbD/TolR family protein [Psychroflexus planctonicus]|uniref:Biopolymer transporter ExbD n=1 Tax=Psychroflexus planctonicus TaxID=1526575 RepID=A0ABQ1SDQ3_9FLAO|nr:biopolymer transporter ExbD [Psychroflexus planctonicus]GGE25101.1 biopolymer transporter ExbD [Psychroflexus planctonicus]
MSKFKKKGDGGTPAISTASLPDIVFMLLFFFMVVTVMRDTSLKVQNVLPFADQTEKLDKKDLVMYIYAGKPSERYQQQYGSEARIQLNDKYASVSDIQQFIFEERQSKREELVPYLTTALKVDQETNMGLVSDIKQELRKAEALKINYTTKQGNSLANYE